MVVVQTVDGKLLGLDASTGEQRWRHNTVLPVLTLRGTASPVISAGVVFAGLDNGKLIALSAADGITRWEQRVAIPQGSAELDRVAQKFLPLNLPVFTYSNQEQEIESIVADVEQKVKEPLYRLTLATGSRRKEMLGLKWSDVRDGYIYIRQHSFDHEPANRVTQQPFIS